MGWGRKEYLTYPFDSAPRSPPRTMKTGLQPDTDQSRGPDDKALRQIYLEEPLWRLPRVEA
jgi:hypothetical protein